MKAHAPMHKVRGGPKFSGEMARNSSRELTNILMDVDMRFAKSNTL